MRFESGGSSEGDSDSCSSLKMVKYLALKGLYDVEKTIGSGGFAKVKLATHLLTGEKVAIKIMDKSALGEDYPRVKLELEALKSISHHHICKLFQVIDTQTHIFMVMEYCSGGELFDHIVEKSKLSESESRTFFRQIMSAVAYLHKVGYAHRDLKPENILLDRDLNLKLIDFGLCAKPFGGMGSHLQTSCGSPTYAAPELIKGQHYLGSQVDVWSMGVLLYALLCGFLPFDCDNIESLYKKILSGKYEEPPWLSRESRQIIRDMLQVDPNKRISVDDLLSHPWMTVGVYEPVTLDSLHEYREKDNVVLELMGDFFALSPNEMWDKVSTWAYDYITATYLLLLNRRKAAQPLKLSTPRFILRSSHYSFRGGSRADLPWRTSLAELTSYENVSYNNQLKVTHLNSGDSQKAVTTPRKVQRKRGHDWTTDEESPVAKKRTPLRTCTPRRVSTNTTPHTQSSPATPSTPGYKFLHSIEKKMKQVRQVLTPRKRGKAHSQTLAPAILSQKEVYNVSTTSSVEPLKVMEELKGALERNGIDCRVKGYNIRGKVSKGASGQCKLSFELEVVLVAPSVEAERHPSPSYVVGVKRKRLKGDPWFYKKVCEEVLTLAHSPPPTLRQ